VTYAQAMKQFEEHRQAAQESRFRWIPENPHTEDQKQTPPGVDQTALPLPICICISARTGKQRQFKRHGAWRNLSTIR
jgi:hypothetical protein